MKPCGRTLLRLVFEEAQRLVERDRRRNHALDAHGVELLELLQLARLGGRPQAGEGRQRHELVARSRDVDLRQLIGRQALGALDLRNHLVAPALDAEPVDVVAAEQRRQILAGLAQVDALRAQLVAIEDDLRLRLVELQVGVGEDEQPARERLLHELAGKLAELLRLGRRGDHEVDGEVSAAGQRRRRQRDRADARDLRQRPHRLDQELLRCLGPLAPRLGHHAAEAARREA